MIGEREGPHRVRAALHHAGVDVVGGREPRLEHPDRREHVGHEQEVHDEAGAVLRADDPLAEPTGDELLHSVRRVLARHDRRDELDQVLHRHRVEEVEPEHVLGTAGRHRELHDRDRRRVRRQDRVVVAFEDLVDVREQIELLVERLDDGLDDELTVAEVAEVGGERDPAEHRVTAGGVHLVATDRAAERFLDALERRQRRSWRRSRTRSRRPRHGRRPPRSRSP